MSNPSRLRACALATLVAAAATWPRAATARVVDGIAAVVNEDVILVSEINDAMRPLIREYRQRYSGDDLRRRLRDVQEAVVSKAIEDRLILQVAKNAKIEAQKAQVEERLQSVIDRFGSVDEFEVELRRRGITSREYRAQIRDQLVVQDTIRQVVGAHIRVTDNEIAEYYHDHRDRFSLAAARRISAIFLPYAANATPANQAAARRRAEQIRMLSQEGADFAELAGKFSQGPHRGKGGDIGYVTRGEILPDLEEAAFSMNPNAAPAIVETATGVHVLMVSAERPGRVIPLSEARPRIQATLTEQKQGEKYREWIDKLMAESYIDRKL